MLRVPLLCVVLVCSFLFVTPAAIQGVSLSNAVVGTTP